MAFQATIIPPARGESKPLWEILITPEHWPSQTNSMATLETVSHFANISLCTGYTGAPPEITESEAGIRIRFEGGHQNFTTLERVLEWLSNPIPYNY